MKKKILVPLLLLLISCSGSGTSSSSGSTSSFESSSMQTTSEIVSHEVIEVSVEDLVFELSEDETGYYIKNYKKYDPYIKLPASYNGLPVIGISRYAFRSSTGIKDIYIPNSIKDITGESFADCFSIENIIVEESHEIFSSVDGLLCSKDRKTLVAYPLGKNTEFTIPNFINAIAPYAFTTSKKLTKVIIPDTVTEIGEYAFSNCKSLTRIEISNSVVKISKFTFSGCNKLVDIIFGNKIQTIGESAFYQCISIKELVFPDSLITIEDSAFEQCNNIITVTFNNNLVTIGNSAFAYCERISTLNFSNSIKTIGRYAFIQNFALNELILPEGIISLDEGAFFYNTHLTKVTIPSTLESIGFQCFVSSSSSLKSFEVSSESKFFASKDGVLYSKDFKTIYIFPPKIDAFEYNIDDTVEEISDQAFYNAKPLKTITLPKNLKKINRIPFYLCKSLTTLNYKGTMDEFNAIEKVVYSFEDGSEGPYYWYDTYYGTIQQVVCSDGTITIS